MFFLSLFIRFVSDCVVLFYLLENCKYFGADFVHDGSRNPVSPPPYIDPYALLEDERISGINSRLN